jgi:hypothetical protein
MAEDSHEDEFTIHWIRLSISLIQIGLQEG